LFSYQSAVSLWLARASVVVPRTVVRVEEFAADPQPHGPVSRFFDQLARAAAPAHFLLMASHPGVTSPAQQIYSQGFAAMIFCSLSVHHSRAKISFVADSCS
jgi:hypothetical protein